MSVHTESMHATCVADPSSGRGVLLVGPPGSGKSDTALRLMDGGWKLVADDRVLLAGIEGRAVARAPAETFGLLEVRGVGLVAVAAAESAAIALMVECLGSDHPERLPAPRFATLCDVSVPILALATFEASAAAKIRRAVALLESPVREGVTFPFEIR